MNQEHLINVIRRPLVTEKTAIATETSNQYGFEVLLDATKPQIKKAVELMFEVEVSAVTTSKVKGKKKVFARRPGKRNDWKKAYVTLKPGFNIDITQA
jgi:large subunit ribosomal protein L23